MSRITIVINTKVTVLTEVWTNDIVEMSLFIISERVIIVWILMDVILK